MGLKGFFDSVFEESEEELAADIKEADELIKERKRQIEELRQKKAKEKAAPKNNKPQPKKRKSSFIDYLYFIIPIAIAAIIIVIGISLSQGNKEAKNSIYCEGDNECPDCEIVVSCVSLSDEMLSFKLTNQLSAEGNCIADILFSKEGNLTGKKTYSIGTIASKESIKTKIPIKMPDGETQISVLPTCEW